MAKRTKPRPKPPAATSPEPAGLPTRRIAADILEAVLRRHQPLDELLDGTGAAAGLTALAERDRALVRALVATVLRRLGTLRYLLALYLERGLPADAPRLETVLLIGAAQLLWLDVPDHAAVDLAVRLARADRHAMHFAGLANAVLRRIAREGKARLADIDPVPLDTPPWLMERWIAAYGADTAHAIARAHAQEPALDFTVKDDPAHWASVLGGRVLATGSVRAPAHGPISALPGFADGAWWIQDAAAALPARLLGEVRGLKLADLCAAPGGKTAQLALAGAHVTAVDRSEVRLERLRRNLERLQLAVDIVPADVAQWQAPPFDAVLLDAPCSSTGTIRRHPDVPWRKRPGDIAALVETQHALMARAIELTRPGGRLVYCVCSLEPEEGAALIAELLAGDSRLRRLPITADEVGGLADLISPAGDLRTLPCQLGDPDPRMAGLDGFFAARLGRI